VYFEVVEKRAIIWRGADRPLHPLRHRGSQISLTTTGASLLNADLGLINILSTH